MGMILSLIPENLWILVLVGMAFGVIFGIVPRGAIIGVIVTMLVFSFVGPMIGSIINILPWWVSTVLTIVFCLIFINWGVVLLFGKRTGSHLSAMLLYDVILAPLRLIGLLFRRR